jgi:D-alanine-D-alanine ligase
MVEFFTPARISESEAKRVSETAVKTHQVLGLRDWSRIDLILDKDQIWFLEATISPGLTETSLLPLAAEASEKELGDIVNRLIIKSLNR